MILKRCRIAGTVAVLLSTVVSAMYSASAARPGDEHWDNQFGPVGANDILMAIAVDGLKVYVGGYLTAAGNTRANLVAGFEDPNWFALNKGIPTGNQSFFYVSTLAVAGRSLYAGGWFTEADSVYSPFLARWDGNNWSALRGAALNAPVLVVKPVGTNLYVGGYFTTNVTMAVNGIAQWDGANWSAVGSGVSSSTVPAVAAIESDGASLYVGGMFTMAGGVEAMNVARWDGVAWFALGTGLNGPVRALAFHGGHLYAGGSFTNASLAITNLAKWDGNNWSAVEFGANRSVWDLLSDGTNLYAGGNFTRINGVVAIGVARWDGLTWAPLGTGLGGFGIGGYSLGAYKMALSSGRLYVAGVFNRAGNVGVSHVAGWDGTNWFALGGRTSKGLTHFDRSALSFLPAGTNLYAGGIFTEAGDVLANGIAQWNGIDWSALGGGLSGTFIPGTVPAARALVLIGPDLYVGGNFTNAGGIAARGIARWDGNSWSALGAGADSTVRALANIGSDLYVGGSFTNIGGIFSPGIALWVGIGWLPLGGVSGGSRSVATVVADGNDIYIGGNFTSVGPINANNIARWHGNQWSPLTNEAVNGVNGTVNAIAVKEGVLYAGGSFTSAGTTAVNRIARWDGTSWSALGDGITGDTSTTTVSALLARGTDLYVGGIFTNAGGVYTLGLAKWNGTNWSTLGSALAMDPGSATVSALAFMGNDLYVGGRFIYAGDKPSMFIARWNEERNFYPLPQPRLVNPTWRGDGSFRFRLVGTSGERYTIETSINLGPWTPLVTNSATLYDFTDATALSYPTRNYRAVVNP